MEANRKKLSILRIGCIVLAVPALRPLILMLLWFVGVIYSNTNPDVGEHLPGVK